MKKKKPAKKVSKKRPAVKKAKAGGTVRRNTAKIAKKKVVSKKVAGRKLAKRKPAKKFAKKTAKAPKKPAPRAKQSKGVGAPKSIGQVTHFYGEIKVAVIKFSKPVKQGTPIVFRGATTDFAQNLDSMQYDHKAITKAPKGKQVGVKVKSRVRQGDRIYPG